jgi:D-threonate/D-erythronate kinase
VSVPQPCLAIIADDLTGGLDTGVAFAARGWRTVLRFARGESGPAPTSSFIPHPSSLAWDAFVWDTETRHADEEAARRIVREVCEHPSVHAAPRAYKKIDSTLRGPWLAELREVWKARAPLTTLVCPAFPAVGRTLVDGELRVHGRSLAEAGFSGSGRLRDYLIERWCGRVVSLAVSQLPQAALFDEGREPWLLLPDAATDADLDILVGRLHQLDQDRLLCGAGGLAAAWARVLIPECRPLPPLDPLAGPIWIIAGSQHEATRAQMEALGGMPWCHAEQLEANAADLAPHLRGLPERGTVGLTLTCSPAQLATSSFRAWAADCIAAAVDEAQQRGVAAFVATGGETAVLLLRAMEASAVEIDRELLPGIPLCRIADGPWSGTALVTKAGGFGEPDALARAVTAVRAGGAAEGQ